MLKKALFVFNPLSGKGIIKTKLFEIIEFISSEGYEVTVYPTQKRLDAYEFILNRAPSFDLLIIGGGDGTLNESVKGILEIPKEKRPVLGYIPLGSTNDFASSLGIPKKHMAAVYCALNGVEFSCDIGRFGEECFVYVAAFGAFTEVAYDTPQEVKNYLGHMAYILEGIKRLPTIKSYVMEVMHDDVTIKGKYIYGMISNSTFVGGVQSYKKNEVDLNDGVFECLFIKEPENPIELQSIITGLLMQDFSSQEFCTFKAAKINIRSNEEISWTLDGEYGGDHTDVVIENMHSAINIMVNKKN